MTRELRVQYPGAIYPPLLRCKALRATSVMNSEGLREQAPASARTLGKPAITNLSRNFCFEWSAAVSQTSRNSFATSGRWNTPDAAGYSDVLRLVEDDTAALRRSIPAIIFHQAFPRLPIKIPNVFYPHEHSIGNRVGH